MPATKAQLAASRKYIKEKLDEIKFRVPKGQRAIIKEYADRHGESINAFIYRAVNETMARDQEKPDQK